MLVGKLFGEVATLVAFCIQSSELTCSGRYRQWQPTVDRAQAEQEAVNAAWRLKKKSGLDCEQTPLVKTFEFGWLVTFGKSSFGMKRSKKRGITLQGNGFEFGADGCDRFVGLAKVKYSRKAVVRQRSIFCCARKKRSSRLRAKVLGFFVNSRKRDCDDRKKSKKRLCDLEKQGNY